MNKQTTRFLFKSHKFGQTESKMNSKIKLGANLSVAGGYASMIETSHNIGGNVIQCFIRNPRSGDARQINEEDEKAAALLLEKYSILPSSLIAHAPYTMNPCSAKSVVRDFTKRAMREDFEYLERLPGVLYNFHPGSFTTQTASKGIRQTAHCLAETIWRGMGTSVLIETMSGKGSEIGRTFDEIARIIDLAENENPSIAGLIGVCLDTCHVYDGGYDIVNDLDGVLDEFDSVIGLDRLKAIHLNDSKNPLGSHKDRHEKIGQGTIGTDALVRILTSPRLSELPFCLETPNEPDGYADEIKLLREHAERT